MIYKVSYVVQGGEHPGAIANTEDRPQVGDRVQFGNNEFEIIELPESLVDRRAFINYSLLVSPTSKGVRIERIVEFMPGDLAPEEYPLFIDMLRAIDEKEVEPIVLNRIGGKLSKKDEPVEEAEIAKDPPSKQEPKEAEPKEGKADQEAGEKQNEVKEEKKEEKAKKE